MKKNVMVVCGNSIEDLENGVQAMKQALAAGAVCGIGGTSLEEIEAGLKMAKALTGATPTKPHKCNCDCGGVCEECECEDLKEEEEEDLKEEEEEDLEEEELEPQAITGRMLVELLNRWEQEMK